MASGLNPTASRLELAARLRELRQEAGRSLEDAAAELMCSVAKISRMETGGRGVQPRDVRDLCRLYGVSDQVRSELDALVNAARVSGWWKDYGNLYDPTATFIGLEDAATSVRMYEGALIPGLLQTSEYTRELIRDLRRPGEVTESWIAETVAARERRQKRIESGSLFFHVILDEATLVRPVGAPDVMRRQFLRLIDEAARPNVTLQVIPFARGPHRGMEGSFQCMSFSDHRIDDIVYFENLKGMYSLDKGTEVAPYREAFDDLAARFALDPEETVEHLRAKAAGS
jgi:transcriptional regulator with XRE-family HTH domain